MSRARKTVSPNASIACAEMSKSAVVPASGTSTVIVTLSPTKSATATMESVCPRARRRMRALAGVITGAGPQTEPPRATRRMLKLARA